jgi:hypothetical protein
MNRNAIKFLQGVIVLIGLGALALMLWEPHLEGRNAHATLVQIYFNDPFLAYAYFASIAFFVALFQAFKLLNYVQQNTVYSQHAVNAVKTIKYCTRMLVSFIVLPVAYLFIARPDDDIAGGVAIGLFLIVVFSIIAVVSAMVEKRLKKDYGIEI